MKRIDQMQHYSTPALDQSGSSDLRTTTSSTKASRSFRDEERTWREGARPRAPRTGLRRRRSQTLDLICVGLREPLIARTRSLPMNGAVFLGSRTRTKQSRDEIQKRVFYGLSLELLAGTVISTETVLPKAVRTAGIMMPGSNLGAASADSARRAATISLERRVVSKQ
jgi:hypothetical protein